MVTTAVVPFFQHSVHEFFCDWHVTSVTLDETLTEPINAVDILLSAGLLAFVQSVFV